MKRTIALLCIVQALCACGGTVGPDDTTTTTVAPATCDAASTGRCPKSEGP